MKTLDENQLQGICRTCGRKYRCKDALRYLDMQDCNQYAMLTNCTTDELAGANDIKVPPFTDGLKEIIEATEKHKEKCDKIRTNVNKWGRKNICDVDDDIDVLTNEDWFCGLSTEEKAKFLRQIYRDGRDDYVGEWYEQTESDFIEWLKQPHSEVGK